MADKLRQTRENEAEKLSNVGTTKRKEIPVSKTEQEIFEAKKISNWNNMEQSAGVRTKSDCETKPK